MRKLLLALLFTFSIFIPSFANIPHILMEGRIGPIGITDQFNMACDTKLFGDIVNIKNKQHALGHTYEELVFDNAKLVLKDNVIITIIVDSKYAKDGTILKTPRGICIDDDLKQALNIYGIPDQINPTKISNQRWYLYYGGEGSGLSFLIDMNTHRIIKMATNSAD